MSHLLYSVLSRRHLSLQGKVDSSFPEKLGMSPWCVQIQNPALWGTERTRIERQEVAPEGCGVLGGGREKEQETSLSLGP